VAACHPPQPRPAGCSGLNGSASGSPDPDAGDRDLQRVAALEVSPGELVQAVKRADLVWQEDDRDGQVFSGGHWQVLGDAEPCAEPCALGSPAGHERALVALVGAVDPDLRGVADPYVSEVHPQGTATNLVTGVRPVPDRDSRF